MRGNEEQFANIIKQIATNSKKLDDGSLKYIQWADLIDSLFGGSYGWSKDEFAKECNVRLGKEPPPEPELKGKKPVKRKTTRKKASL